MLSTAARYVAQLMLPGGLGLRSTALTSSSISGIHDAADGAIGGTVPQEGHGSAVLAIQGVRITSPCEASSGGGHLDGTRNHHGTSPLLMWWSLHSTI